MTIKLSSKQSYSAEQFQKELSLKNYNLQTKDVGQDFIPTKRKRMSIGNENIDIYSFSNPAKMERIATNIDKSGCSYNDGNKIISVSWALPPHFFKKGNIIVLYSGENEKIVSDLKDILGNQFAGFQH